MGEVGEARISIRRAFPNRPGSWVTSSAEVSEHLVGSAAFKAVGTGDPRPAGSIPVHLRQRVHGRSPRTVEISLTRVVVIDRVAGCRVPVIGQLYNVAPRESSDPNQISTAVRSRSARTPERISRFSSVLVTAFLRDGRIRER